MDNKIKVYKKIFSSSFYISIFIIGGGYVAIPLLQKKFVDDLNWIEKDEMTDLIAIAQSAPGAVAVNSAISVGYKVSGVYGAAFALIGTILPPLILITAIQTCYEIFIDNIYIASIFKGMNCAVAAIMLDVILSMSKESYKALRYIYIVITMITFLLVYYLNVNPVFIVISCIIAGISIGYIKSKKGADKS